MNIQAIKEFESSSVVEYLVKGHVNIEEFRDEAKKDYGVELDLDHIYHCYYRLVPQGDGMIYILAKDASRGSFPVTVCSVWLED